jgi:hypothetical protein
MSSGTTRIPQPAPVLRERRKPSSAAVVAAQVKARAEFAENVEPIVQTRAEKGTDPKTGKPILIAVFPRKSGAEPHRMDLSFLLSFPNLQPMFTEAFLLWGASCKENTRSETLKSLKSGFFKYLMKSWPCTLAPREIDDELLIGFREYLLNSVGASGKPRGPRYTRQLLGALRSVLGAVDVGLWADSARRIVERVPPGPIGANSKSEPTEVLGLDQLLLILAAAEKEVLAIEERFAGATKLMAEGHAKLNNPGRVKAGNRTDYSELAVCLAALDDAYPDIIPDLQVLVDDNSALGRAVWQVHGQREVCSYFFPSGRDIVPFVLLLAIATVFNAETVLNLKWSDIDFEKDRAGTPAVEIRGAKDRAIEDFIRLLDPEAAVSSQLSLKRLLSCLQNITARIRPAAMSSNSDCLFLCIQQTGTKRAKSVGEGYGGGKGGSSVWKWALVNFIKDNQLPPFTLKQLRPTILNLVQFIDGSLEAAQRVGNHKRPVTTWTHYTSSAVRKRYRERIGQIIVLRERWLETEGVIDPRRLMPGQEKGAATPGFLCLNPLDSPRPNQQPGRLCKDYGGCPACPMAAAFPNDSISVGYYSALELAIYRSQPMMSTKTWLERWVPVLADLRALLALTSPDVLDEARKVSIKLPNVG